MLAMLAFLQLWGHRSTYTIDVKFHTHIQYENSRNWVFVLVHENRWKESLERILYFRQTFIQNYWSKGCKAVKSHLRSSTQPYISHQNLLPRAKVRDSLSKLRMYCTFVPFVPLLTLTLTNHITIQPSLHTLTSNPVSVPNLEQPTPSPIPPN